MEEEKAQQNLMAHPNQQSTEPITTFEVGQIDQQNFQDPEDPNLNIMIESENVQMDSCGDAKILQPNTSIQIGLNEDENLQFMTSLNNPDDFNLKVNIDDDYLGPDSIKKPDFVESVQIDMNAQMPAPEFKKASKKSNRENRLITDLYNLKKVKYTLDFGSSLS